MGDFHAEVSLLILKKKRNKHITFWALQQKEEQYFFNLRYVNICCSLSIAEDIQQCFSDFNFVGE
jgi:hypothetical protein